MCCIFFFRCAVWIKLILFYLQVKEYYEDVYAKAPKSPVISPPNSRVSSRATSPLRPVPVTPVMATPSTVPMFPATAGVIIAHPGERPLVSAQAQNHQEMLDRLKQVSFSF